jgi:hypothetical protein
MKGTEKRVGVLISEQVGDIVQLDRVVPEVVMRQLATSLFQQLLESEVGIGKTTLQCARAHTHFPRSVLERRSSTGQRALERLLDLLPNVRAGPAVLKLGLQPRADSLKQLLVVRHERQVQIALAKDECVAACFEADATAKVGFQQLAILHRTGQFHAQWCEVPVGAPAADSHNPTETQVHQYVGQDFLGVDEEHLHGDFIARLQEANFLRTAQLLVAGNALD